MTAHETVAREPAALARGRSLAWWMPPRPERWLGLFFVCALLLPPLPFPFGNAGIHVAPLAVLPGFAAGIRRRSEWRTNEIKGQPILPLLLLFLLVLLLSVAFAAVYSGWKIALGSLARVMLLGIAAWVFAYTWIGPRDKTSGTFALARLLFWIALLGALFACVDFYFQFPAPARYGGQFIHLGQGAVRRAQGLFYESSTLGNFCAFFLVMSAVAAFTRRERRVLPLTALLPGALVFAAALMLSASRASIVTLIVAAIAFVCMRRAAEPQPGSRRVMIAIAISIAVAAGAIRLAAPDFWWHYWRRTLGSAWYFGKYPDGVLAGRLTHWSVLTHFVVQHPWHIIFGIGYKTLPYTSYPGAPVVADNTYLSLLIETGVVGLAVFALLNIAVLRAAYRAARSRSAHGSFFGLWMFCFWCGELVQMLSGDLITYWRVLPVYFWVLAAALRETSD